MLQRDTPMVIVISEDGVLVLDHIMNTRFMPRYESVQELGSVMEKLLYSGYRVEAEGYQYCFLHNIELGDDLKKFLRELVKDKQSNSLSIGAPIDYAKETE